MSSHISCPVLMFRFFVHISEPCSKDTATGQRTSTVLNTGEGDDTVTVTLSAGQDGFFVLNTQACCMFGARGIVFC